MKLLSGNSRVRNASPHIINVQPAALMYPGVDPCRICPLPVAVYHIPQWKAIWRTWFSAKPAWHGPMRWSFISSPIFHIPSYHALSPGTKSLSGAQASSHLSSRDFLGTGTILARQARGTNESWTCRAAVPWSEHLFRTHLHGMRPLILLNQLLLLLDLVLLLLPLLPGAVASVGVEARTEFRFTVAWSTSSSDAFSEMPTGVKHEGHGATFFVPNKDFHAIGNGIELDMGALSEPEKPR